MRVSAANNHTKRVNKHIMQSAKMGALLTCGSIAATQAYSWIAKPETMRQIVSNNGGKLPYVKNLIMATVLYSSLGAVLSALVSKIADKIAPVKQPKAVN